MYIEILDNFHILFIENWFADDEVIFQDESTSQSKGNFFRKGI